MEHKINCSYLSLIQISRSQSDTFSLGSKVQCQKSFLFNFLSLGSLTLLKVCNWTFFIYWANIDNCTIDWTISDNCKNTNKHVIFGRYKITGGQKYTFQFRNNWIDVIDIIVIIKLCIYLFWGVDDSCVVSKL